MKPTFLPGADSNATKFLMGHTVEARAAAERLKYLEERDRILSALEKVLRNVAGLPGPNDWQTISDSAIHRCLKILGDTK